MKKIKKRIRHLERLMLVNSFRNTKGVIQSISDLEAKVSNLGAQLKSYLLVGIAQCIALLTLSISILCLSFKINSILDHITK